ncbi:MAG: cytochrome C biogenesis protein CcdA [Oceanicaulis sp.]|uniref:cytochrome c-type biogenesis protein n=1 Tax=unclassified Oceanicaulis TaxID=2632123 RepID=UPI000C476FF4|nr:MULTISPECIES: cytochrome c-type biogenesis protein [unclassified Oceanicaulis]MAB68874.1 cytochrome C biogenesis protein CcdA [Oceanicaulis sp.]MBC39335.1 cytochrome C biogenesis protein CcdA [Oceanicaulis sp.]MBG35180.1 cytochrome C biogenesis protein CcdA [Oceanicaulis sp.]HCR93443.1 cytochrome c-type biogenesis protein CcmH [Oceanicaulis sp.]|tara:strand:- start:861 stop:1235 length:375 start_codon:yes stop_codon:yes gene_type:complete
MKALILALALAAQAAPAGQLSADDEARAQALMREVRCMVCAGESILDSNAAQAQDMRRYVREQVAQGADDDAVREALVQRFGYAVLMRPPVDSNTILLWVTPVVLVLLGGGLLGNAMRKRPTKP